MQRPDLATLACVNAACQLFRHTGANGRVRGRNACYQTPPAQIPASGLPHWAPALGPHAKPLVWIRMIDADPR